MRDIIAKNPDSCFNQQMNRVIFSVCAMLLFPSTAYALSCNQWYDTMSAFIAESEKMNGALSSISKDAAATCTYSRKTKLPTMQRNLKVIRSFYGCQGETGRAAKQTGASLRRLLNRIASDTASKCAEAGM